MKKIILGVIVLVVIGGIVVKFREKEADLKTNPIKQVMVEIVGQVFSDKEIAFGSFVKNSEEAMLLAQVGGSVDKFYVNEGDYMRKGQVIAHISIPEVSAQYAQAKAQVEISEQKEKWARRKWDDYKPEEREQFKLQNKQARAFQAEVGAILGKAVIKAPFSGIISKKFIEEGSTISPGMQIAYFVGDKKEKELTVAVPVSIGEKINVGDKVLVREEDREENAKVVSVNPVSDSTSRKVSIKISLDKDSLFSLGAFVDVVFLVGDNDASGGVSVAKSSVLKKYDDEFVFVLNGQKACLQSVEIIGSHGEDRVFVKGLERDSRVITSQVHNLGDCEEVVVDTFIDETNAMNRVR